MNKKLLLCLLVSITLCLSACTKSKKHHDHGGDDPHATACEELGLKKSYNKIINGVECKTSNSAIVEILVQMGSDKGLCTGTIISANEVLSAAHCFNEPFDSVTINAGGNKYNATDVILHPAYETHPSPVSGYMYDRNDLAIVRIAGTFSIKPIPIITSASPNQGETLIVAGYGKDENGNTNKLKAAYMNVHSTYKSGFVLAYDDTHTNVCFGDSGGPAFGYVDGVLGVFGVTSTGSVKDCLSGDKTFFPNLSFAENKNFILANTTNPSQL